MIELTFKLQEDTALKEEILRSTSVADENNKPIYVYQEELPRVDNIIGECFGLDGDEVKVTIYDTPAGKNFQQILKYHSPEKFSLSPHVSTTTYGSKPEDIKVFVNYFVLYPDQGEFR